MVQFHPWAPILIYCEANVYMPMPKVNNNETEKEFVSRCIKELTTKESKKFPTISQRAAICYNIYKKHKNSSVT